MINVITFILANSLTIITITDINSWYTIAIVTSEQITEACSTLWFTILWRFICWITAICIKLKIIKDNLINSLCFNWNHSKMSINSNKTNHRHHHNTKWLEYIYDLDIWNCFVDMFFEHSVMDLHQNYHRNRCHLIVIQKNLEMLEDRRNFWNYYSNFLPSHSQYGSTQMFVFSHLRWFAGQVVFRGQRSCVSSDVALSLQSLTPLHTCDCGIHRPLRQVNSPSTHGGYVQPSSSE